MVNELLLQMVPVSSTRCQTARLPSCSRVTRPTSKIKKIEIKHGYLIKNCFKLCSSGTRWHVLLAKLYGICVYQVLVVVSDKVIIALG